MILTLKQTVKTEPWTKRMDKLYEWCLLIQNLLIGTQLYHRSWSKLKEISWNRSPLIYILHSINVLGVKEHQLRYVEHMRVYICMYVCIHIMSYVHTYIKTYRNVNYVGHTYIHFASKCYNQNVLQLKVFF